MPATQVESANQLFDIVRTLPRRMFMYVDIANISCTCKNKFDRGFDFRKLYVYTRPDKAFAFDMARQTKSTFQAILTQIGYELNLKKGKSFNNGKTKCDQDVDIVVHALEHSSEFDTFFLITGDGDFAALLKAMKAKGKKVVVIGSSISYELKEVADYFLEIKGDLLRDGAVS